MKTIYRTSFTIQEERPLKDTFDRVAAACHQWVFDPQRGLVTPPALEIKKASTLERTELAGSTFLEAHSVAALGISAWGLRFTHPEKNDPSLLWTSELGLLARKGTQPCFSCSVGISRRGTTLAPIRQRASRPRIVPSIVRQFNCVGAYRLMASAIGIQPDNKDISTFLGVLQAKSRTHPIVFISAKNEDHQPTVNGGPIADKLAGLAHVVVATSAQVSWLLREKLPNWLLAYDGAVRLYWPGFHTADSQFDHPLWTSDKILSYSDPGKDLAQVLLDAISAMAVFNLHDGILTWDRIQSLARAQAIEEAKLAGKNEELLSLFEEDNRSLNGQIELLKNQLALQAEELKKHRTLAETYLSALQTRKKKPTESTEVMPAASVQDAIEHALEHHAERLVFSFNAKSEHDGCPFEQPEEVERAFNWLASTYWCARTGSTPCNDLDKTVREAIPGWSYSGGQKKGGVGKYEDWYKCHWNGQEIWIGEHLRCGTSTDPTETIRIAFAWDKAVRKVIIGFIGQHQRNRNS
jgi:hypothetical protein